MTLYQTRMTDGFQVKDVASMEIGDVFEFTLKDGEAVKAMAVKKAADATDFITVDCLEGKDMPMNLEPTSEGGVDSDGDVDGHTATYSFGIRPRFRIANR